MIVLGGTPTEAVVVWELFGILLSNPKDDRFVRSYIERTPDQFTVNVSFDNWGSTNLVTSGSLLNIPLANQGNQMILSFEPAGVLTSRHYIGSWAVIY
jgi:hypothetical protein